MNATEIILNDKEMEVIIRELITKAVEKGYRKTNITKAIVNMWDFEFPLENMKYEPNEDELEFWHKVKKFIESYGALLLDDYNRRLREFYKQNGYNRRRNICFLNSIEKIICVSYSIFIREESITKSNIEKYGHDITGHKMKIDNELSVVLDYVISYVIGYNPNDYAPVKRDELPKCIGVLKVPSYKEFQKNHL